MARLFALGPLSLVALAACASETKPAPGAEACLGGGAPAAMSAQQYSAIGLPGEEPDLQAWVVKEQSGLVALTTKPCAHKPPTRLLRVPADAPVVELGHENAKAALAAGQRVRVWFQGGSTGTAAAVLIERVAPWPPAGH